MDEIGVIQAKNESGEFTDLAVLYERDGAVVRLFWPPLELTLTDS